tara:strand:- start:2338 stop:2736 length:399 start_codon:yes stop_codon:yes gene_type:complete
MAFEISNIDEVIQGMAKLETVVDTEVIREVRKNMRATTRSYLPLVKGMSPKDTGALVKSVKIKGRSRRGVSKVSIIWGVPYAGPLNFKKGQSAERYASDFWEQKKAELEQKALVDIKKGFSDILGKYGIEIK